MEGIINLQTLLIQNKNLFITSALKNNFDFESIKSFLKKNFDIDYIELKDNIISKSAIELLTHDVVDRYNVIPIKILDNKLVLAMENPLDMHISDNVFLITGMEVIPFLSKADEIKNFINTYYINSRINFITSQFLVDKNIKKKSYYLEKKLEEDIQNAPTVKLIDSLIESAIILKASDIHIEPYENTIRTRYRIDGYLKEFKCVDKILLPSLISRIKIMSEMDIGEKRIPQDGHFKIENDLIKIDFRVSTAPTIFGEKAVIRLIYSYDKTLNKNELGFFLEDTEKIKNILKMPHGAILVTGPTGSGKTTTLYSFLKELNKEDINIVTIEDPVENIIYGVNQINVNPKAGLDFSNILRSILRQDPDVIMIGEIRDNDTADISIRAAITGHVVLSTLHTGDVIGSIIRLLDMGIKNYLITSAIKCIISQKLIRCLCNNCKKEGMIGKDNAKVLNLPEDLTVFKKQGCEDCNHTGYKGRTVIYEMLFMDENICKLIENNIHSDEIKKMLNEKNHLSILDCGIKKLKLGITSEEEILKTMFLY